MNLLSRFIQNFLRTQRAARTGGMDRRHFLRTCILGGAALPLIKPVNLWTPKEPIWVTKAQMIRDLGLGKDDPRLLEAQRAFATFVTGPLLEVIERAPIITNIFEKEALDSAYSIPLSTEWNTLWMCEPMDRV